MFNNYKLNLKENELYQQFIEQIQDNLKDEFILLIDTFEFQVNQRVLEQEKLLDQINNLQLQTQNKLDQELANNFELQKQINQLNEQLQQQNTQISFLNKSMKNVYIEQLDLFSPIKAPSLSPQITRTQSMNKQVKRKLLLTDKENDNQGNCYSSIKKIRQNEYFLDEQEFLIYFKEQCMKEFLDKQMEREQELYNLWQKMQNQSLNKCQQLQETIDFVCSQMDAYKQQYHSDIKLYTDALQQLEIRVSKYKIAFQYIIQNNSNQLDLNNIIHLAKTLNTEFNNVNDLDKLIDLLMEFNQTSQKFNLSLQNNQNIKIQNMQNQIQELELQKKEYNDIKVQRLELLELSQQMNSKIIQQSNQIEEMNQQIASLTQLFAKSLQDLERIQGENETLRKSYNCNTNFSNTITTRTQEGSVSLKNHFIANRYSTYIPRESISCKNSYRIDQRQTNFSSDFKKSQPNYELDDICCLLDQLLNQGYSNNTLDFINNFQCQSGNFKIQMLWQKLKDFLVIVYYSYNQQDDIFISLNKFITDLKLPINQFELIIEDGLQHTTSKLESNSILLCQLLHRLVSDIHDMKSSQTFIFESNIKGEPHKDYSQIIMQELTNLSKQLIHICQENDDIIVLQIERQIEIQEQLKLQRNKQLRDIQTSTCKILMELFKEWKQNYLNISQILLILCKGWQQLINYQLRIENIFIYIQIMNSIIQKYFNQIAYGNTIAPLTNPQRVLELDSLVFLISSFLEDEDLLHFIQINSKIRYLSKGYNQLNVRVLQIRITKQKKILDNFIEDPSFINSTHHNQCYFYQFYNKKLEQKYFINLQDLLRTKKVQQQSQIQLQNNQPKQNEYLIQKVQTISTEVSKKEIEKQISNIQTLINQELEQPIKLSKFNIKIKDITKNLCPIVQYNRAKHLAKKIKTQKQYEIIHL
ncbi:unnamed protein product [Paramecium primaurelia]|uniref:Uncharacterized protein n=1 Tax=Paramecium primaurelia TaxID=5886 RepID=A0A8S1KLK4_PARPR|nr:unnamed protein product [Paramecium primaurelia]